MSSCCSGAALIIVVVFTGLATGKLVMIQLMGFQNRRPLIADATLIRMMVVPAATTLLGCCSWYLPSWLNWMPCFTSRETRTPASTTPDLQTRVPVST